MLTPRKHHWSKHFFETLPSRKGTEGVTLALNGLNYVKFKYKDRELLFLVDTGASISIVFKEFVSSNENINFHKRIKIHGLGGSVTSQGSVYLQLTTIKNISLGQEFLLIPSFDSNISGILGSDFLTSYGAKIDYELCILKLRAKEFSFTLDLLSQRNFCFTIPSRCQSLEYVQVNAKNDCVILPHEISEGVFVAGTMVRPVNGKIPVQILNTRETAVTIKNFIPKIQDLSEYEMVHFSRNNEISVSRVDKVLNLLNSDHLSKDEKYSLQRICAKYSDVFHVDGDPLTVTNVYKQKIRVKDSETPSYVKPYRLPYAQKSEIHSQIQKMLSQDIIEETKSEWSSPLLIVPKKADQGGEKKWRVVVDYRLLNKRLEDDRFPLPCISDILDSLSGAIYFSHLDLSQGYYQIELDKDSRHFTAFTTDRGQYQMKRLPMGLKISPSAFSRAMTIAMSGLNYESCFIYLDDLIVFGNNLDSHNRNLTKVLDRLRQVNLKLNPFKCDFLKKEICYLGHIISADGVSPDPEKIVVVKNYPTPKDANESKRFVAMANYYRRFIRNFACIAAPLNNLSRKNVTFNWTPDCQTAFENLKKALVSPPILQYPDFSPDNVFILRTDASGVALGAILSNGNDRPIAFASRSLNKAEKNYCTIEKELLAIVWAVKHFRPYLYGRKFAILTDHRPLVYLFGMTNPSSRLTKFRLVLEEFDFTIKYTKGRENVTADALSRIEISCNDLKNIKHNVDATVNAITRSANKTELKSTSNETTSHSRTDHPGVVELVKRPKEAVELRMVNKRRFKELKNLHDNGHQNSLVLDDISRIIFIKEGPRSTSALGASLRDLQKICRKLKIEELLIVKSKDNACLIEEVLILREKLNDMHIKIVIVKDVQTIVDKDMKQLIINDFHMLPTGGHAGINRMYNTIKRYYFWNGLKTDIEKFVRKCDDCQRYKHSRPFIEKLTITTTASTAFQKIYLDLVGPLERDGYGNQYILTCQCELSKFVEGYPIPNKEAVTVADALVKHFVLRYGIPNDIVTDRGTEFMADVMKEVCKLLTIQHLKSTSYHHETLGSLENTHKHLGFYLRKHIAEHSNDWSNWVPYWCFSFNNTVHTESKYTPFELVFGKTCNIPSNITSSLDPLYNFDSYPLQLKYRLQRAWQDAQENLINSKLERKSRYDIKSNFFDCKVGDSVLLKNESGAKMEPLFRGPFKIKEVKPPNVILEIDSKLVTVHKNRVKPYFG